MSNIRNAVLGWAIVIGLVAAALSWLARVIADTWPVLLAAAGAGALIALLVAIIRRRWTQDW